MAKRIPALNIDRLNCDTIDIKSVDADWGKIGSDQMEDWFLEACECGECGVESTEYECPECGNALYQEGPMMNYYYEVPGLDFSHENAMLIAHLPLCLVKIEDPCGDTIALALTGGGMDLSWEICEAFIRLGRYPPVHFCDLPRMGGMKLTATNRKIIRACLKGIKISTRWTENKTRSLKSLRKQMKERD